jgi:hypothetical protein
MVFTIIFLMFIYIMEKNKHTINMLSKQRITAMQPREYFSLGKAYGEAFCNRSIETETLIGHIKNGKHTFLVAPRGYGKSSLCEVVFAKVDLPSTKIDFHLAINEDDAQRFIVQGVAELIGKAIGRVDKLQLLISRFLKTLKPKLALGPEAMRLELEINPSSTLAENVAEAILLLDKLLIEKKTTRSDVIR